MQTHIAFPSRRVKLAAIAAAALLGTSLAAASAPAAPATLVAPVTMVEGQPAQGVCYKYRIYEYYSDASHTTHVGQATEDCDGTYIQESGYATPYYKLYCLPCPI